MPSHSAPHAIRRCTLAMLGLGAAMAAPAAVVDLTLTDASGKPLPDAVALIEPIGAKVAVKPMADAEISQAKRQFMPRVTVVTVGTKVNFPNFDKVRHQVYSFSPTKSFELKLYAGVPNAPVVFDKPGIAVLGCNIHDYMVAWVVVADTPWFARTDTAGRAQISDVPVGSYRLRLWHANLPPGREPIASSITVTATGLKHAAQLDVHDPP